MNDAKDTPIEELVSDETAFQEADKPQEEEVENPLDKIAYFVIFPQNTKVLDEAIAIIPNDIAKKAVTEAINSILVPVTKEQVEEYRSEEETEK